MTTPIMMVFEMYYVLMILITMTNALKGLMTTLQGVEKPWTQTLQAQRSFDDDAAGAPMVSIKNTGRSLETMKIVGSSLKPMRFPGRSLEVVKI